ncbi:NYN domain-containing protein [Brachybacterium sp. EF45031]|uniref:NYN domain-containing protein n=1 Tax=Brachybacterium sillae TaxID=2810536 RepID=UPI00217F150A|nr:NYN domain-containing protein [Brachybacterium sillae]MCS6711922.1 NYN domain-containing protein [Brachybacterium sillae]
MPDTTDPRVAVYLDFDNIVMSWYDRIHGRHAYSRDRQRIAEDITDPEVAERLAAATVDVGAIIDYAASFGALTLTRAYADWSAPVNATYRQQLVGRAVDLVQLFPAAAYGKNGADIRLAVDAVEDMFRIPALTHVVIVAGDSDYVALAQRCRRLGRYVVGMGVTGSTAKSLAAACDEFEPYDQLPGVEVPQDEEPRRGGRGRRGGKGADTRAPEVEETTPTAPEQDTAVEPASEPATASADTAEKQGGSGRGRGRRRATRPAGAPTDLPDPSEDADEEDPREDPQEVAARLLRRALQIGDRGDSEWLHSSAVKSHMRRMDPSFSEKALGFRSFSDFVKAHADIAELEETGHERLIRARD